MEMYVQAWIWMGLYVVMIPVLYFVVLLLNRKYIKLDPDNVHHNIPDEDHAKVILVQIIIRWNIFLLQAKVLLL